MHYQVKKLALRTFLKREWSQKSLVDFEPSFVVDVLMQLLGEAFLHNNPDFDYEVLNLLATSLFVDLMHTGLFISNLCLSI